MHTIVNDTLINDDCLNALPRLAAGSANLVLTDPPYLARYVSRDGRKIANDDNDGAWLKPAFGELHRVLAPDSFCISFYGWPHVDLFMAAFRAAGFRPVGHFTFPKRYTSSRGYVRCQHENAFLLAKGRPREPQHAIGDVLDWTYSFNKFHPTQKPIPVLLPLIETFSAPGDLVLDPFAGSGSTLIAARMAGRRYLGIEIDPSYNAIAQRRLATEVREASYQPRLLASSEDF